MTTQEYIAAIQPMAPRGTIYGVSKLLEIDQSAVRHYVKGRRGLDPYACTRVAELLELPPLLVIADIAAERETNPRKLEYWQSVATEQREAIAKRPTGAAQVHPGKHPDKTRQGSLLR